MFFNLSFWEMIVFIVSPLVNILKLHIRHMFLQSLAPTHFFNYLNSYHTKASEHLIVYKPVFYFYDFMIKMPVLVSQKYVTCVPNPVKLCFFPTEHRYQNSIPPFLVHRSDICVPFLCVFFLQWEGCLLPPDFWWP